MCVKIRWTHSPANQATSHTQHLGSLFSIIKYFFSQKSKVKSNYGKTFYRFLAPLRRARVQKISRTFSFPFHWNSLLHITYFGLGEADPHLPPSGSCKREANEALQKLVTLKSKVLLSAECRLIARATETCSNTILQFADFPRRGRCAASLQETCKWRIPISKLDGRQRSLEMSVCLCPAWSSASSQQHWVPTLLLFSYCWRLCVTERVRYVADSCWIWM